MRKILLAAAALITAGTTCLRAEGYQVNTLSAKQNGMGHTGVAMHLGAESMIFNPAGVGFMDNTIDAAASVTGIFATAKATHEGVTYETDNDPATPMSVNLGMSINKRVKVGLSFYTPYGSSINWGINWPGAVLNQKVKLTAYTIQPTVAWRPIDNLSFGAGLMFTWGQVDLNKGLVSTDSFNALMAAMQLPVTMTDTPASVNLNGKATPVVGFNIGAMWDINKQWTLGASVRTKMKMHVKSGVASVSYANETARTILESRLNLINNANFEASMPAAAIYNIGVSYRPTKRWIVALDLQMTGWNAYKELNVDFKSDQLADYDQHLTKNYHNSMTYHIGAQYSATKRFDVRAGLIVDTTPVDKNFYNPETPGMTKIEPSVGLSFRPAKNFSIDASLLYVAGLGEDNASCPYPDFLTGRERSFVADYKVQAWNPSVGVSFNF